MTKRDKIFGIGLSRTGTTSLTIALTMLGYNSKHFPTDWEDAEKYDALTDTPVTRAYKELDVKYPSSKFILTIREIDSWLESCRKYFALYDIEHLPERRQLRMDLYNTIEFDREKFIEAYKRHHNDVLSYFKDRQEDLLIINICAGERWDKLCKFLNKPIPPFQFPRANTLKAAEMLLKPKEGISVSI